jgi:hypothetical protein
MVDPEFGASGVAAAVSPLAVCILGPQLLQFASLLECHFGHVARAITHAKTPESIPPLFHVYP